MPKQPSRLPLWLILTLALATIAFLPWMVARFAAPLRPEDLLLTPTFYVPTQNAVDTYEAEEIDNATSAIASATPDLSSQLMPGQIVYLQNTVVPQSVTPTPTRRLPQVRTATALPPAPFSLVLTDQIATETLAQDISEIRNPNIHFSPDGTVKLTGQIDVNGPLNSKIATDIEVFGKLLIVDGKMVVNVTKVTALGQDVTEREGPRVERRINNWLRSYLVRREVTKITPAEGQVTVEGVEYRDGRVPTIVPTPTAIPPVSGGNGSSAGTPSPLPTLNATEAALLPITFSATPPGRMTVVVVSVNGTPVTATPLANVSGAGGRPATFTLNDETLLQAAQTFPRLVEVIRVTQLNVKPEGMIIKGNIQPPTGENEEVVLQAVVEAINGRLQLRSLVVLLGKPSQETVMAVISERLTEWLQIDLDQIANVRTMEGELVLEYR